MFSTQKNVVIEFSSARKSNFVGKYLYYPDLTQKRSTYGGLRIEGKFKGTFPNLPLVTVITVCRNSENTLEQCILSVLRQTYENLEYIIVDGGSTDDTLKVINRYKQAIDYFVSEPDRSLYHAMNKGLELARGDYILFLNSDDWYEDDCVESLWQGLDASGADFSCALTALVDRNGKFIRQVSRMPYNESIFFGMPLRHELMFLSAHIYNSIGGYNEKYEIVADFDLAIRIYKQGFRLYEINRSLLYFRTSGVSNTNWPRLVEEHNNLLSAQFPHANPESLASLSDPRTFNADLIDKAIADNSSQKDFVRSLLSYGYRRGFFDQDNLPAYKYSISPRISVIVPVFNSSKTIERCLNSVISQNVHDIEIIFVNDGSTDDSAKILNQMSAKDSRVHVINNSRNCGVSVARNVGVAKARGEYCFFLDSDDETTKDGLEKLLEVADRYQSDITRGTMEKVRENEKRVISCGTPPQGESIFNKTIFNVPELIATSEGFTTCLYRRFIVQNCHFIEGMSVGEDSLFLIKAFLQAMNISWVNTVVYRYNQHGSSAMKNFTLSKYLDAIEWRERVWIILNQQGLQERANWFAFKYWNPQFFSDIRKQLPNYEFHLISVRLSLMLQKTGFNPSKIRGMDTISKSLVEIQKLNLLGKESLQKSKKTANNFVKVIPERQNIRVGVFNTWDKGGAAKGSIRRITALRECGVDATLHPLVSTSSLDFVKPLIPKPSQDPAWKKVHQNSILPAKNESGYCSMEMFSLPYSIVDYTKYTRLLSKFDILHLHWVVGILDYQNVGEVLGDKPIVWTLADMNAFTGGCHYSEGCEGYQRECQQCPLLGSNSKLTHEAWKTKQKAYAKIKNLEIICPSAWLAEKVKKSTLLGTRKVHVIPNAYPTKDFTPVNKLAARLKLNLPLNKKLILFGADNLKNMRKGGDLLADALKVLKQISSITKDIEVVAYGNRSIDLPLFTHSLGFLKTSEQLKFAYSACDVYVFPSREDNAPLTVGESLLCGTPVVAFPVGNVPDLVEHKKNGYIASYKNTRDLAEGLRWVTERVSHQDLLKMSINCRLVAANYHDPTTAAERHISLYRNMLGGRYQISCPVE